MNTTKHSLMYRLATLGLGMGTLLLAGCGMHTSDTATLPTTVTALAIKGNVHGGQQPVAGANIQLYATNNAGYGSVSYALLTTQVTTDAGGNFTITGDYTCPTLTSMVYITSVGGNPGLSSVNPNIALMAALGQCSNLNATTSITINELTTVGSVYALAPFMTGYTAVGTSAANATGLTNAFAAVNKLVNTVSGAIPGASLPAGATLPTAELNTLADILASCVNSAGGSAGDGSTCGTLFTLATSSTSVPQDTIGAILNIAKNPGNNASQLLALATATGPFQPTLATATDFTVAIKYKTGGFNAPTASALDTSGNLWVTNGGNNTVTELSNAGTPFILTGAGLNGPAGVAIDAAGNAWVTNRTNNTVSVFTPAHAAFSVSTTGLNSPTGISIDGQGILWITNTGANSVAAVTTSGTTATGTTIYSTAGLNTPSAVAINPH